MSMLLMAALFCGNTLALDFNMEDLDSATGAELIKQIVCVDFEDADIKEATGSVHGFDSCTQLAEENGCSTPDGLKCADTCDRCDDKWAELDKHLSKCIRDAIMNGTFEQCEQDLVGDYLPTQCDVKTAECWCVYPDTGKEVPTTRARGKPAYDCEKSCLMHTLEAKHEKKLHTAPRCMNDGEFHHTQDVRGSEENKCVDQYGRPIIENGDQILVYGLKECAKYRSECNMEKFEAKRLNELQDRRAKALELMGWNQIFEIKADDIVYVEEPVCDDKGEYVHTSAAAPNSARAGIFAAVLSVLGLFLLY